MDSISAETSSHVRRAVAGEPDSIEWIIFRFGGALRAHAHYRLAGSLGGLASEDDLVQEVWLRALPRLPGIEQQGGRLTPVLVKFLGRILVNVCFELRKQARRRDEHPLAIGIQTEISGIVSHIMLREESDLVLREINALDNEAQAVLILRLMEDLPNSLVAQTLSISASAASRRYTQAIELLRKRLPLSFFEDIESNSRRMSRAEFSAQQFFMMRRCPESPPQCRWPPRPESSSRRDLAFWPLTPSEPHRAPSDDWNATR